MNLKWNRGRTVITILLMVMSITVFVALQRFSSLLDTSRDVQQMYKGDYAVTNETAGIPPEAVAQLEDHESVAGLAATKLKYYEQDEEGNVPIEQDIDLKPSENFQIAAVDEAA